ncbi:MAG: DUF721 domain-containing protein [Candidatus Symbiothrix sp.]|jgi:predicted nucleic acid-binding Zn ribbon protein|nr:DUF721 domain-containing protein [Candidatus Symbiothrix sp.]
MERKHLEPLKNVLHAFLESNPHLANGLAETQVIDYWQHQMGVAIARYTSQLSIRKRVLYVKLTSSVLKNELLMHREHLIGKLNGAVGRSVLDNIVFL